MSWKTGAAVQWEGQSWHVFDVDAKKQTVELCDKLLMHGMRFHGKSACTHIVVTEESLAQQGSNTRPRWIKEMMDQLDNYGLDTDNKATRDMVDAVAQSAADIMSTFEFRNNWLAAPVPGSESVEANDRYYAHRESCYGWSVLWQIPSKSDELFEYPGELHADECGSLEACWDFCDYLIDDEVGKPLAIRDSLKCAYFCQVDGGRWLRNRGEYPDIPAGYNTDEPAAPVRDPDDTLRWMASFPDDVLNDHYFKDELGRHVGERLSSTLRQEIINNVRERAHHRDMGHH